MISAVITVLDWNSKLLDYALRIIIASLCGFIIGFERKTRSKEAGIRTHTIVALAATLMMIVSKYGFTDTGDAGDKGRIAAQIVSGIGFLGAGIIFYRRDMLHGLTTAAGIWATAGIGMAIGAGMMSIGIISTIILLFFQLVLHRPIKIFRGRVVTILRMTIKLESEDVVDKLQYLFGTDKFLKFKTVNNGDSAMTAEVELSTDKIFTAKDIYAIAQNTSYIITLEKTDEI